MYLYHPGFVTSCGIAVPFPDCPKCEFRNDASEESQALEICFSDDVRYIIETTYFLSTTIQFPLLEALL